MTPEASPGVTAVDAACAWIAVAPVALLSSLGETWVDLHDGRPEGHACPRSLAGALGDPGVPPYDRLWVALEERLGALGRRDARRAATAAGAEAARRRIGVLRDLDPQVQRGVVVMAGLWTGLLRFDDLPADEAAARDALLAPVRAVLGGDLPPGSLRAADRGAMIGR